MSRLAASIASAGQRVLVVLMLLSAASARADAVIPVECGRELALNPVTKRIYVVCADKVGAIDGATHAIQWLPFPGLESGGAFYNAKVDPIQDRLFLTWTRDRLYVIDGDDFSFEEFLASGEYAVDPAANRFWTTRYVGMDRVDGRDFSATEVPIAEGEEPRIHAIDTTRGKVYATAVPTDFPGFQPYAVQIDAETLARELIPLPAPDYPDTIVYPGGIVTNPANDRFYTLYGGPREFVMTANDADTRAVIDRRFTPYGAELWVDPVQNRIWWAFSPRKFELLDGDTLGLIGVSVDFGFGYKSLGSPGLDPVTNLAYFGVNDSRGLSIIAVDGETALTETIPVLGRNIYDLVVDPTTSRVITLVETVSGGFEVRILDEPETAPVPIHTELWHDTPDAFGNVVVHFAATTEFAPHAPDIQHIWTRVDSLNGPWAAVTPAGAAGTASFTLPPGVHTIFAFATDGQEANTKTPIVGTMASLAIEIRPRPACANDVDDDGDGAMDFPDDSGCKGPGWRTENPSCANGRDDDADGSTDFPADTRCRGAWDDDESSDPPHAPACGVGGELTLVLLALARIRFRS